MSEMRTDAIDMFQSVRTFLDENDAMHGALPAIVAALDSLRAGVDGIDFAIPEEEVSGEKDAQDEAALRNVLDDHIRELADAVYAYARGGNALAKQAAVTVPEPETDLACYHQPTAEPAGFFASGLAACAIP